ncbi:uncharacterized protein ACA1_250170 [Acanthamoeba castellanii str. Neff]|uniref:Uncharacterized protein n=1 Tax=Acanthamoeba castellanii (strain ATCC 30010 / Neff) TaxID=1257118 RepID=L8HEF1_ACACF|nr:uncharacterized protein ACA1_250170 [Acanthamoeba castellanii str. Neff]ELR23133.1 hypothetical protein ACA1_250170 [Acanthamoeba castellanii str. Neff]
MGHSYGAAKQNAPTESDFRAVAAVVHGHVGGDALISAVEKDIIGFCPELVDFVRTLVSSAAAVDSSSAQKGKVSLGK